MRFQFNNTVTSDTLDYQNGEYSHRFNRREQPFEATPEEWAGLQRTGYFEPVKEEPPAQDEDNQAAQAEGQSAAPQKSRAKKRAVQQQPAVEEENLTDELPNA
jgi:hypothetical protein